MFWKLLKLAALLTFVLVLKDMWVEVLVLLGVVVFFFAQQPASPRQTTYFYDHSGSKDYDAD